MSSLEELKFNIRENDIPYFSDVELQNMLDKYDGDIERASYECLIMKSQDTSLSVSGYSAADTSGYFKRLASRFKPRNSGILGGS